MAYYGRGRLLKTGFLPVEHPFSQMHQNTGVFVIERSDDGITALVGAIAHVFAYNADKGHTSTTEVLWTDIKF